MKIHGNMCTQPSPCEQAQAKKGQQEAKENSPCSFLTKKEQLGTHTREPSL